MSYNGLTVRQTVRQSAMIHPDWDLQMHLWYLENEAFFDLTVQDLLDAEDELNRARHA